MDTNVIYEIIKATSIPNWTEIAMVVITLLYFVATVGILIYNRKTINFSKEQQEVTKKQLDESIRQFEEAQTESKRQFEKAQRESENQFLELRRLQIMPYLELEVKKEKEETEPNSFIVLPINEGKDIIEEGDLIIKNAGQGTAFDIRLKFAVENGREGHWHTFNFQAIRQGDEYRFLTSITGNKDCHMPIHGEISFAYEDIIGKTYIQTMKVVFQEDEKGNAFIDIDNGKPQNSTPEETFPIERKKVYNLPLRNTI